MCSRMVSVLSEEIRWAYGLIGPSGSTASHVSEDPLEQVLPHLLSYLVSYIIISPSERSKHHFLNHVGEFKFDKDVPMDSPDMTP